MKKTTTKYIITALFASIIAAFSQIVIPLPSGVPMTLQTFAVALCGFLLSYNFGALSVIIYILIGLVGAPVFSLFGSGLPVLLSKTGGFLWGFLVLALLCGLAQKSKITPVKIMIIVFGILLCHICGIIQFSLVYGCGFLEAFVLCSLPFLLKDFICVFTAFFVSNTIKKRVNLF